MTKVAERRTDTRAAPVNAAVADEEMAAAPFCAPDRRRQGDRTVDVLSNAPTGARLLEQVKFDHVAAAAWANHRSRPWVRLLPGDVDRGMLQRIGKVFDTLITDPRSAVAAVPAPSPQLCQLATKRSGDGIEQPQGASSGSLSSGIDRSGSTSPLPMCVENMPDAAASTSRYWPG